MLFSNFVYFWLLPPRELRINFEDVILTFDFGWCFWLVMTSGGLCLVIGVFISVIDLIYPHKFSIMLEMDYGTPFDRHTIIEDSHKTKKDKGGTSSKGECQQETESRKPLISDF